MRSIAEPVSCPYTCGELFQGTLDGQPCLVSCPVALYNTVKITPDQAQPPLPDKAQRAVELLSIAALPPISLQQRLPAGRGYGTSTADIGSVLYSATGWTGLALDPFQVSRLAVSIEPTDSSLFPGLALFDHRRGEFYENLGLQLPITMVIIDSCGEVDSEAFNNHDWATQLKKIAPIHRQAFDILKNGIVHQDVGAVGEAATMSAKAHQAILYNPCLELALALAQATRACGICRAHSVTILGLLFAMETYDQEMIIPYLKKHVPEQIHLRVTELTGGGPVYRSDVIVDKIGAYDC